MCVCVHSLTNPSLCLLQMSKPTSPDAADSIQLGSVCLSVKVSSNGRPYILLSQPLENKKDSRCCWFQEDWEGIKTVIPQVQSLVLAGVKYERKVRTSIRANREVIFTIGRSKMTVRLECSKEPGLLSSFSTTFDLTSWSELVAKTSEIDLLVAQNDPKKRKRDQDEVARSAGPAKKIRPREVTYYGWTILSSPSILTGTRTILHESYDAFYTTRAECEAAARQSHAACAGDDLVGDSRSECLVHERVCKIPDDLQLVFDIYLYAIHCKVAQLTGSNCTACEYNQPGQSAHMSRGCLMPWDEAVDMWGEKAEENVTVSLLVELHAAFMERVGGEQSPATRLIAQCVKAYVTDHEECLQEHYDASGATSEDSLAPVFKDCFKGMLE